MARGWFRCMFGGWGRICRAFCRIMGVVGRRCEQGCRRQTADGSQARRTGVV
jgi:hypothetical protein